MDLGGGADGASAGSFVYQHSPIVGQGFAGAFQEAVAGAHIRVCVQRPQLLNNRARDCQATGECVLAHQSQQSGLDGVSTSRGSPRIIGW